MTLPCPHCGRATDSLKGYRLPTFLLFLGIGASFKHGLVVRCPPCMRKELGRLTLINILPANLLWVVLLLPWYGIATLRSFTSGHSKGLEGPSGAPGYRQPDRPALAVTPMGKPWHDDPALRAFISTDAPDDFNAVFEMAGFGIETLRVRMLRRDQRGYLARLLEPSKVRDSLQLGDEIVVHPTEADPPLRWVPEPPIPPWLGTGVERAYRFIFLGVATLMVLIVATAGYTSESAGVLASYPAAGIIGFCLGLWRGVPWARETRKSAAVPLLLGVGLGVLFVVLALVFFEGIFPAL